MSLNNVPGLASSSSRGIIFNMGALPPHPQSFFREVIRLCYGEKCFMLLVRPWRTNQYFIPPQNQKEGGRGAMIKNRP